MLYVHLPIEALFSPEAAGVARVEDIGPILTSQLRDWLQHSHLTINPVLDPGHEPSADSYEIPPRLREAIHLTSPAAYRDQSRHTCGRVKPAPPQASVNAKRGGSDTAANRPTGTSALDRAGRVARRHGEPSEPKAGGRRSPGAGEQTHHYQVDHTGIHPSANTHHPIRRRV